MTVMGKKKFYALFLALFFFSYTISAYQNSNVTLYFCDVVYSYVNDNANLTVHNSTFNRISCSGGKNITIFNSTINNYLILRSTSFVVIAQVSKVAILELFDTSGYYLAPDSSIYTVNDNRGS